MSSKTNFKQVLKLMLVSSPMILFFQNCATRNFDQAESASQNTVVTQNSEIVQTPLQNLNEKTTAEVEQTASPPISETYEAVKAQLMDSKGQLNHQDWAARISQLTDLEQNMDSSNEQEVVAIGREVLDQLIQEIDTTGAVSPDQWVVVERSVSLLSYGIKNPQDKFDIEKYFLNRTQNSQLSEKLSKSFAAGD